MRYGIALFAILLVAAPASAQHEHGVPASGALDPAASRELEAVRATVARYEDHEAAVADGYRRFGRDLGPGNALMGEHWFLPGGSRDSLGLERPSTLIYASIDGGMRLVGVAWSVFRRPGDPMPEGFTGDADRWHVHHMDRMAAARAMGRPLLERIVERRLERGKLGGGDGRTELTMLHAWTGLENPAGVFVNDNVALPYARLGLPLEWADPGDPAAARGVGLLLPEACENGRMAEAASAACAEAAARVRGALEDAESGSLDPAAMNAVAAEAWRGYRKAALASLTPEQRERLAAMRAATTHD
jgi:hypothetical protein